MGFVKLPDGKPGHTCGNETEPKQYHLVNDCFAHVIDHRVLKDIVRKSMS